MCVRQMSNFPSLPDLFHFYTYGLETLLLWIGSNIMFSFSTVGIQFHTCGSQTILLFNTIANPKYTLTIDTYNILFRCSRSVYGVWLSTDVSLRRMSVLVSCLEIRYVYRCYMTHPLSPCHLLRATRCCSCSNNNVHYVCRWTVSMGSKNC